MANPTPTPKSTLSDPSTRLHKQSTQIPILRKQDLVSIFQKGPQPLIASLRVYPKRKKGRFIGFEIKHILPHSPLHQSSIKVGDVILRINREPIGKPQEVMRVWELVQQASVLQVDLLRDGHPLTLKWKVE